MTGKAPRLLPFRQRKGTPRHGSWPYYAEKIWPLNKRNLILVTAPNGSTRKCYDPRMRENFSLWSCTLVCRHDYDLGMRKISSPRSQTRAIGKISTMESLVVSRQMPRHFPHSELKSYSLLSYSFLSFYHLFLPIYVFLAYPSFPTIQTGSAKC